MLTRCPNCQTWFRVRAEHLSVAAGQVTCGQCDTVFNALASLIEEPAAAPKLTVVAEPPSALMAAAPPASSAIADAPPEPAASDDSAFEAVEIDATPLAEIAPAEDDLAAAAPAVADPPSASAETAEPPAEPTIDLSVFEAAEFVAPPRALTEQDTITDRAVENAEEIELAREPEADRYAHADIDWESVTAHVDEPTPASDASVDRSDDSPQASEAEFDQRLRPLLPEAEHAILFTTSEREDVEDRTLPEARNTAEYYDELARLSPPPPRRSAWWTVAALVFVFLVLAQVAWLERERIAARWPQTKPLFEQVCAKLGCAKAAPAASIRMIARDLRDHPQYVGALLVNATMINDAATPLPYPDIELRLHDAAGNILRARRFAPVEYLDDSIAVADGMPPARPVHVMMEIGGDTSTAVSFEFTFM